MANKLYEETSVQAIATAIRGKNGSSDTYTISQMAPAIDALETGGGFYPSLLVSAAAGSTVTATNGTDTVTLTEIESGKYWGEVTDYGEWTVTGGGVNTVFDVTMVEQYVYKPFSAYTPEEIAAIGATGEGASYFAIGDAYPITLNGTIGTKSFSDVTLYMFIVHFNYEGQNGVYLQGFKTADGVDVALRDWTDDQERGNVTSNGTKLFNINHWGSYNYGGWKACDLRYDILGSTDKAPSDYGSTKTTSSVGYDATSAAKTSPVANTFMAALPADFRSALAPITLYVDNTGNQSDVDANVTACVDYCPLPTAFNIHGQRTHDNQYEQNHQEQFSYYAAGNSKVKYAHDKTSQAVIWWCSSPSYYRDSGFCIVSGDGSAVNYAAFASCGLAPVVRLAA